MEASLTTVDLEGLLERHRNGDPKAKDALLERSLERLRRLAQKMFHRESNLKAFDQTDDVLSTALIRLHRALEAVHPDTVIGYMGLASNHIRMVLIDLGRQRVRRKVAYPGEVPESSEKENPFETVDFHEAVEKLPESDRKLFDLLVYEELEQVEAANLLGIPLRTLKRHWQQARFKLQDLLEAGESE